MGARPLATLSLRLEQGTLASSIGRLRKLPSLTDLTLECNEENWCQLSPASDWPLGKLTSLSIDNPSIYIEEPNVDTPATVLRVLAGSAGARRTLRRLCLNGAPLDESVAAAPLRALTALCRFDYTVLYMDEENRQEAIEDADVLRIWLSRRLPGVEVHTCASDL